MAEATQASTDVLTGGGRTTYPSDEEILGIGIEDSQAAAGEAGNGETGARSEAEILRLGQAGTQNENAADERAQPDRQRDLKASAPEVRSTSDEVRDAPGWLKPLLADQKVGAEAKALWEQHQAYREVFPLVAEARAVKELFPGGVEGARQALARVEEVDRIDAAYFGGDPRGQARLAEYLLANNPQAFQSMLGEAARVLAERDPAAYQALARQFAEVAKGAGVILQADKVGPQDDRQRATGQPSGELAREREQLDRERQEFRAAQYGNFQQTANDAVVRQVRQTIERTVAGALPAAVPEGARKRIADDILGEINATLQNDRGLTRQVAALVRQWQFTDEIKQQVVNLIFGRARTLVPTVAKRVVADWTSSMLAANRAKREKQETAARRVDITGGGAQESIAKRALTPKDIDYRQTTDEQILSM